MYCLKNGNQVCEQGCYLKIGNYSCMKQNNWNPVKPYPFIANSYSPKFDPSTIGMDYLNPYQHNHGSTSYYQRKQTHQRHNYSYSKKHRGSSNYHHYNYFSYGK